MGLRLALLLVSCTTACTVIFSSAQDGDDPPDENLCIDGVADGLLDDGEECDDGNSSNEDACTNRCKNAICGDGFVRPYVESCDDDEDDTCEGCVTCENLASGKISAMVDGRCYIVNTSEQTWPDARESCMASFGGELAAIDGFTDPAEFSRSIYDALNDAALMLEPMESLPSDLWLGMFVRNDKWTWLGSEADVVSHWAENQDPLMGTERALSATQMPYEWTRQDNADLAPSLCMRVPPPDVSPGLLPSSRMFLSPTNNHIFLEQRATFRTDSGIGAKADHEDACQARKAHLATLEETDVAVEIAAILAGTRSYVGAEREADGLFYWVGGQVLVDDALWEAGKGPTSDTPTDPKNCAVLNKSSAQLEVVGCGLTGTTGLCEWD